MVSSKRGVSRLHFESQRNMLTAKSNTFRGPKNNNIFLKSKRSMEMAFGTIVVMVLAIALLIFLLFIFTKSGTEFKNKIGAYFSPSNVDSIVSGCNNLEQSGSKYDYCCVNRSVSLGSGKTISTSCSSASRQSWGSSINNLDCSGAC